MLAVLSLFAVPADSESILTIYYTASLNGNLDGCNCPMNPVAGLVKRAAFLRSTETTGSALMVDAGDIFDEYPDPDLADHIVEVYRELGYAATAVGDQELIGGARSVAKYGIDGSLICHNLRIRTAPSGGQPFTREPLIVERAGVRIGIIALIDPETVSEPLDEGIEISDPLSAARAMLRLGERAGADLTVLLYHGPLRGAVDIVRSTAGIDVVIFAHEQTLMAPREMHGAVIASPGEEGNRVGILTLHLGRRGIQRFENEFRFFSYARDPDDPEVRRRADAYRQTLRSRIQ